MHKSHVISRLTLLFLCGAEIKTDLSMLLIKCYCPINIILVSESPQILIDAKESTEEEKDQ